MKKAKRLFGLILTFVFVLTLANLNPDIAKANGYTYRVKICIGNNEDASFIDEGVDSLKAKYGEEQVSVSDDMLTISGFDYGDEVEVSVDKLIEISPNPETGNTKYYISGLRVSGGDTIVTQATQDATGNRAVTFNSTVRGDEDYVVAYGVGATIPYTVKYVDAEGNALALDDTYWGSLGEIVLVPARHIDGYYPDALYRTASAGLKEDTVFTFKYTKYDGSVVYIDETTYSSDTVYGEPVYEYQYVNRGTRTVDGGRNTRPAGGNGGGNADQDNDDADTADDNGGDAGAGETTIEDEQTPLDVIDIDDPDTAKHGETAKDNFKRKMIIGILIAIIAVVIILIALFVAHNKRKAVIAKVEEKKNTKE